MLTMPSLNLAALLRIPFQALVTELHERLAEAGFEDIRPVHTMIFALVGREGMRLGDLAERVQMSKQEINHLVNAMEAAGYVERIADATDGRARIVRLTTRGEQAARVGGQIINEIERDWSSRLHSGDMRELRRVLESLVGVVVSKNAKKQPTAE